MRTSDRAIKRGDIVVVPFPYSDRLAEKRRPALVVSNDRFARETGLLWVAMITSKVQKTWPSDIAFDHTTVGLTAPSVIRVAKIASIESERVLRVTGSISSDAKARVAKAIQKNLS